MTPVYHELKENNDHFETSVCVSAQHREMLDQITALFEINIDYDLNLMKKDQSLSEVTTGVLAGISSVIQEAQPDIILVHGDTTTTFATSLAAFYHKVRLCHVEAGLRTYDISAPFPEEFNRQAVSRLATLHFAPTASSRANLIAEGVEPENIIVTGNTAIDTLHRFIRTLETDPSREKLLLDKLFGLLGFDIKSQDYILVTGHRRENFGEGINNICNAIKRIINQWPKLKVIYPVHLNPNINDPVKEALGDEENVFLLQPLNYDLFVMLIRFCKLIISDSGGIQEEAPSLNKPTLVTRRRTERSEGINEGMSFLVGTDEENICKLVKKLYRNSDFDGHVKNQPNPYGDGNAAKRIIESLRSL